MPAPEHIPVMRDEVVHWLAVETGSVVVDGTLGGGGHTRALAECVGADGLVLAMDRDPEAIARAEENLSGLPVKLAHSNFSDLPEILDRLRALGYLETVSPSSDQVLAGVLFEQGKREEALAAYEKLLAEDPEEVSLHISIAGVLGSMERYEQALAHLATAVELRPLEPSAYHNRGVIHERMGQRELAIERRIRGLTGQRRRRPPWRRARQRSAQPHRLAARGRGGAGQHDVGPH